VPVTDGEVLPGLWRFEAAHPEWTEEDGGEEGWEPVVAWWALQSSRGLLLIDPLISDWDRLDRMIERAGGCAGVVRTVHWHQRSAAEAVARYGTALWARPDPDGNVRVPPDHPLGADEELYDGIRAISVERSDEIAVWLPAQAALLFGDAMLRHVAGQLHVCPDSWLQPEGGRARLRELLAGLTRFPIEHVLVSHGPFIRGDGLQSLQAALGLEGHPDADASPAA
jgi:hypothetical protein